MQNGIYHVKFHSPQGTSGEGLIVVKDGSVNGGDAAYLYTGQLLADGDRVSGKLDIKKWNNSGPSIFGPIDSFSLALTGTTAGDTVSVSGGMVGQPGLTITITGRRVSQVA